MTISQHFGRAPLYAVFTVENGKIVAKETRNKPGHAQFASKHEHAHKHGFEPFARSRHDRTIAVISDCQVLLADGMGIGAYERLKQAGIRPILTDIESIDEALQAYIEGRLIDRSRERLLKR
ncbi:MAG: NifB/NifX family molybdenum-iron cluster-binding protein [Archaeoglobaceae archaeon]